MLWGMLLDWVELLVRWTHVIAGITWIGSSFYFVALDAGLRPHPRLDARVKGEQWQVHGGGFYNIQKFLVAPDFLPDHLVWFKWEAYSTWIFGFCLLTLQYYLKPSLYLVDPAVANISPALSVVIGVASLAAGWLIYDRLCKSWVGEETLRLAAVGFLLLVAAAWGYTHVFSGRGAFIHVGALIGSIMVGNVFFIIIPNQRKVVADLLAGRTPPAHLGAQAKQRSVQNNYLTLPVLFTMLSNHAAFTYADARLSWLVLAAVFVASFLVRAFFNRMHTDGTYQWWLWPAAAVPMAAAAALVWVGQARNAGGPEVAFADVQTIIGQRCAACHSAHPTYDGIAEAPKGIMFDEAARIVALAPLIYQQAVVTKAMPLGNVTNITDDERQTLARWVQQGAPGP
jgi:uncharacterized membrane protein